MGMRKPAPRWDVTGEARRADAWPGGGPSGIPSGFGRETMEPDSLTVYDEWEVERPVMPARSRLFSLEPVGVGTAAVESLTGYVARLAEGHTVSTRDLVVQEILPLLRRPHLAATRDPSLLSAFWRNDTRALNGTGMLARNLGGGPRNSDGAPRPALPD